MLSFPFSVEIPEDDFAYEIESVQAALERLRA
jgi:hypothetical protein